MDLNEIKALMDRFDTSACTVLELEEGNLQPAPGEGDRPRFGCPGNPGRPGGPWSGAPSPLRWRRGRP